MPLFGPVWKKFQRIPGGHTCTPLWQANGMGVFSSYINDSRWRATDPVSSKATVSFTGKNFFQDWNKGTNQTPWIYSFNRMILRKVVMYIEKNQFNNPFEVWIYVNDLPLKKLFEIEPLELGWVPSLDEGPRSTAIIIQQENKFAYVFKTKDGSIPPNDSSHVMRAWITARANFGDVGAIE